MEKGKTMSRLIDAERFDVVTDTLPDGMDMESYVAGQQSILNMIYDAPTVQETIRCEDCKYFEELHDGIGMCERDKNSDYDHHDVCGLVKGNWFCADGERRTDE